MTFSICLRGFGGVCGGDRELCLGQSCIHAVIIGSGAINHPLAKAIPACAIHLTQNDRSRPQTDLPAPAEPKPLPMECYPRMSPCIVHRSWLTSVTGRRDERESE